ncbi:MAG: hypothetical protein K6T27_06145 [Thermoleophilum sp.]|nr:hypothetical protein [Thermoleophilum sp.]
MRFRDFLRASVLLLGAAATALAVVAMFAVARDDDATTTIVASAWLVAAAVAGTVRGARPRPTDGIARLIAAARTTSTLPELEPGAILVNRHWPLALACLVATVAGVWFPQVPAVAAGYALFVALRWRNQPRAVQAIEERDGVEFWIERGSPLRAPRLLRLPGLRKIEAEPAAKARG